MVNVSKWTGAAAVASRPATRTSPLRVVAGVLIGLTLLGAGLTAGGPGAAAARPARLGLAPPGWASLRPAAEARVATLALWLHPVAWALAPLRQLAG